MHMVLSTLMLSALLPLPAVAAEAPPATVPPPAIYGATVQTLVLLFGLAVILESALAGLFRWRPFVELLNPRAVRPLVAVIFAWIFVNYFNLDLITSLINAAQATDPPRPAMTAGQIITALVLAGGSAGINSILVGLGARSPSTPEAVQPKPRDQRAWIAVRAIREVGTVGPINVLIGPVKDDSGKPQLPPCAGIISGSSGGGLLAFFTRDCGRFPGYGGYEVESGKEIVVWLQPEGEEMKVEAAGIKRSDKIGTWGPHVLGSKAIIDIEIRV